MKGKENMARKKVLLISSSDLCIELLKDYLRESNVHISVAHDRSQSLSLAAKLRPELLVIDQELNDCSGASFYREICDVPELNESGVILLTDPSSAVNTSALTNAPVILGKPLNRRVFLETGRGLLERIDRRQPRVMCRATVVFLIDGKSYYGTIEDISPLGMFVGCEQSVKIGSFVQMKFMLPWQELQMIETNARITWTNGVRPRRKSPLPPGFGVEFSDLAPTVIDALGDYITYTLLRQPHSIV
jgi:CheY-like chemotaxis protein